MRQVEEAEGEKELRPLAAANKVEREACEAALTAAWKDGDVDAARAHTISLTYLTRLAEVITAKL